MSYQNIQLETRDGVGKIVINRPPVNVLNIPTIEEMIDALAKLKTDDSVKVVAVTAAGNRAFCAGVEVKDHIGEQLPKMIETFGKLFVSLIEVDKPTVAIVNGVALGGGCELVIGCDMAIASDKATIGQPEIKLGVYPPIACILAPRMLGWKKAFEIVLSGDALSAAEAERIGLVNKVVPDADLPKAADDFLKRFTGNSGLALTQTRRAVYCAMDLEFRKALDVISADALHQMSGPNAVEGLSSFVEKRKPNWKR